MRLRRQTAILLRLTERIEFIAIVDDHALQISGQIPRQAQGERLRLRQNARFDHPLCPLIRLLPRFQKHIRLGLKLLGRYAFGSCPNDDRAIRRADCAPDCGKSRARFRIFDLLGNVHAGFAGNQHKRAPRQVDACADAKPLALRRLLGDALNDERVAAFQLYSLFKRQKGIQLLPGTCPGEIFIIPLAADHRAVVAAKLQRRLVERRTELGALPFKFPADPRIRGHTARDRELPVSGLAQRLHRPWHEHLADRF